MFVPLSEIVVPDHYLRGGLRVIAEDVRRLPSECTALRVSILDGEEQGGTLLAYAFKLGAFDAPRWRRWRERILQFFGNLKPSFGSGFIFACSIFALSDFKVDGIEKPGWPRNASAGVVQQFKICCDFIARLIDGEAAHVKHPRAKQRAKKTKDRENWPCERWIAEIAKLPDGLKTQKDVAALLRKSESAFSRALENYPTVLKVFKMRFPEAPTDVGFG